MRRSSPVLVAVTLLAVVGTSFTVKANRRINLRVLRVPEQTRR
jgi:hypothetical protein